MTTRARRLNRRIEAREINVPGPSGPREREKLPDYFGKWKEGVAAVSRALTDELLRLDVRHCARRGWLRPGAGGTWSWGENHAVSFHCWADLEEPSRARGVELTWVLRDGTRHRQFLVLTWMPMRLGGARPWWKCSCGRRRAVLYSAGRGWGCRTCLNLQYASQNERADYRAWRRRDKLRARLGAEPGCGTIWPWQKPKGMWWSTFERLVAEAEQADNSALFMAVKRFGLESELREELALP